MSCPSGVKCEISVITVADETLEGRETDVHFAPAPMSPGVPGDFRLLALIAPDELIANCQGTRALKRA